VSQLKISYFSGEKFKDFEVLYFSMTNDDTTALQRQVLQREISRC